MGMSPQGTNPQQMAGLPQPTPQQQYQPAPMPQPPPPGMQQMGGVMAPPQVPLPAPEQAVDARRQLAMDKLRQMLQQAQATRQGTQQGGGY